MKNSRIGLTKQLTAGVLAVGMLVTGVAVAPKQAAAEGSVTIKDTVIYDESYSVVDYWNNGKKAPVKEGYVFGGWFKEDMNATSDNKETLTSEDGTTTKVCVPLTAENLDANDDQKVDDGVTAIAKFVPAQVLSVKAQNGVAENGTEIKEADDISESNPMWVRVMTSQDSKNYSAIGFDIRLANKKEPIDSADGDTILETNKVFSQVYVGNTLTDANTIFGDLAKFVCVWRLDKIDTPSNANKIIYVRPYWYTMDGTKVEGLAKYVHIEDDYMGYVSIPINILNKEDTARIAAGKINMTYTNANENETVALKFKEVEAGRLLPGMDYFTSGENVINMVGHGNTPYECNSEETLYANIRFKKPDNKETDVDVDFNISMLDFCDWQENHITIEETWDVKYEVE